MDTRTLEPDTPFAPPVGQVPTSPAATVRSVEGRT